MTQAPINFAAKMHFIVSFVHPNEGALNFLTFIVFNEPTYTWSSACTIKCAIDVFKS